MSNEERPEIAEYYAVQTQGGRIIGGCKYCNSIGVHVTGNNGGVHVASTDVIALNQGMLLDTSNGHGSNR